MAIQWTNDLSTGVGDIDEQHKELFNRVNSLLEACKAGKGKEEVGGILDFLSAYVKEHFDTEEQMMIKYSYPKYDEHKSQHEAFLLDVAKLKAEFENSGAGLSVVVKTNQAVVQWLLQHIKKTDMVMGSFLNTVQ